MTADSICTVLFLNIFFLNLEPIYQQNNKKIETFYNR